MSKIKSIAAGVGALLLGGVIGTVVNVDRPAYKAYGTEATPGAQSMSAVQKDIGTAWQDYQGFWRKAGHADAASKDGLMIFFDPLCPHCGDHWSMLSDLDVPQYWVPVGILANGAGAQLGGALMEARNEMADEAFETFFEKVKSGEVAISPAQNLVDNVLSNTKQYRETGQRGVPVTVMKRNDGEFKVLRGAIPKASFHELYTAFREGKGEESGVK